MKRIAFVLAWTAAAASVFGCNLLKKQKDAGTDDEDPAAIAAALADAATVDAGGTGAKNEADILRYATEEKLDEPAIIGKDGVIVRTFPGNGAMVATLNKGQPVTKVAKYFSSGVLVSFDEPGTNDKLLGWVPPSAFAPPGTPVPTVTTPPTVTPTVRPVVQHDAGTTPTVVDAGRSVVAVKDAGGALDARDAGGVAKPRSLAMVPLNGRCDSGYQLLGNMCRMKCNANTDCPRGTACVNKYGGKHCTSDK